jgi:YbbR domain-containing protein
MILYIILAVLFVVLLFLYVRVRGNRIRRGG